MRKNLLSRRLQNRSGIILIVVLWMVGILSVMAISLGRRTGIDITLTEYFLGKQRSEHVAWAGLLYAMKEIQKDKEGDQASLFDNLYQCGISLKRGETLESLFSKKPIGEGIFNVGWESSKNSPEFWGIRDEDSKINLNGIYPTNYKILANLILLLGFDDNTAETVSASVADWHDEDSAPTSPPYGAEDSDYMSKRQRYQCKDFAFESLEELLLVNGMTQELFVKLKPYVTVFPYESGGLTVNLNTAPAPVIRALARSVAGAITNTEVNDADSLTEKLMAYRKGDDGQEATADDRKVDLTELGVNEKETVIFLAVKSQTTEISQYLRIRTTGVDKRSGVSSSVEAVVNRNDLATLSWERR